MSEFGGMVVNDSDATGATGAVPPPRAPSSVGSPPIAPAPPPAKPAGKTTAKGVGRGGRKSGGRPTGSKTRRPAASESSSLADAAADAAATALEREAKGAGRPSNDDKKSAAMADGLRSFYTGLGAMLETVGLLLLHNQRTVATGTALRVQAPECATALVAWSESNAAVRKALDSLVLAGGGALVLAAHAPIIAAAYTGVAPDSDDAGPGLLESLGGLGGLFDLLQQQPADGQ